MSLRTPPHAPGRDRHNSGSLSRRPAVVETDSPRSSSGGRATSPASGRQPARSAAPTGVARAVPPTQPPVSTATDDLLGVWRLLRRSRHDDLRWAVVKPPAPR